MFLIRNIEKKDYQDLLKLSRELDSVNLPRNPKDLKKMIQRSLESFDGKWNRDKTHGQYVFVLVETKTGKVIGTSKIFAQHGSPRKPHVYFQVMSETVRSLTLGVRFKRKFYRFKADKRGYTEIGGLVLRGRYRKSADKLGKQLSYVRFLFMKAHPGRFKRRVIAELLPPLDKNHQSSLWNFYGQNLTQLSYRKADLLSYRNKEFILKLFPKNNLYYDILPSNVQKDIEKTSPGSSVARKLLTRIGFHYKNQIDPFDGGPYYVADRNRIKIFNDTKKTQCLGWDRVSSGEKRFVLIEEGRKVRALVTLVKKTKKGLYLPKACFKALGLKKGQAIYWYRWR